MDNNEDLLSQVKGLMQAFSIIWKFFKVQKSKIYHLFAGISFTLLLLGTFELRKIYDYLIKKPSSMYDMRIEYLNSLVPLGKELIKKCQNHCYFGSAFLQYDSKDKTYSGINLELFGMNENGVIREALSTDLVDYTRQMTYGPCISNKLRKVMSSTHGCSIIYVDDLLQECKSDKVWLYKLFLSPGKDAVTKKHISCGKSKTIINKLVVCVLKSSDEKAAYNISWLAMTNPVTGDGKCTIPREEFKETGCDSDECEPEMRKIFKEGTIFIKKHKLKSPYDIN